MLIIDDMAERQSREVVLHEIDVMALKLLVDYSYTGGILITEDNVQVNVNVNINILLGCAN